MIPIMRRDATIRIWLGNQPYFGVYMFNGYFNIYGLFASNYNWMSNPYYLGLTANAQSQPGQHEQPVAQQEVASQDPVHEMEETTEKEFFVDSCVDEIGILTPRNEETEEFLNEKIQVEDEDDIGDETIEVDKKSFSLFPSWFRRDKDQS